MAEENTDDKAYKSTVANVVSKVLRYGAYPASLVIALPVADVSMRGNLYKNFAQRSAFSGKIQTDPVGVQAEVTAAAQKVWYETLKAKGDSISTVSKQFLQRYESAHKGVPVPEGLIRVLNEAEATAGVTVVEKMSHLINNSYRGEVRSFFKDLGISRWRDYWPIITRNQKIETIGLAVTAGAITIGAMLAMSDHKSMIANLFPDKDQGNTRSR